MSLTDKAALSATEELSIKIKADPDNHVLHITDTGIGKSMDVVPDVGRERPYTCLWSPVDTIPYSVFFLLWGGGCSERLSHQVYYP